MKRVHVKQFKHLQGNLTLIQMGSAHKKFENHCSLIIKDTVLKDWIPKPSLHTKLTMITVWWSIAGVICYNFLNAGEAITEEKYSVEIEIMLQKLLEKKPKGACFTVWQSTLAHFTVGGAEFTLFHFLPSWENLRLSSKMSSRILLSLRKSSFYVNGIRKLVTCSYFD